MFDDKNDTVERQEAHYPLLYEMARSFVALADALNLTRAVEDLGSTRQTVRRHISQLESALGAQLFYVRDRRYELTVVGREALPEARMLLARGKAWLNRELSVRGGLQHLTAQRGEWIFFQQEQSLSALWQDPQNVLLRETFRSWAMAGGEIEHAAMQHVWPYLIVFRHTEAGWVCTEFGDDSFYVSWFGQDFARSSIGRPLKRMPAGEEFAAMLDEAFRQVEVSQSARLDYVFTRMPRDESGATLPVKYQRLMLGGRFPDGSLAVFSLIEPRGDLPIDGLDAVGIASDAGAGPELKLRDIAPQFEEANVTR